MPPDAGTYWFHPHVGMQLDRGLYGALIVDARDETLDYDREAVLVLDDWLDGLGRNPDAELQKLLAHGMQMPGMDMSGDMSDMSGMDMGLGMGLGEHGHERARRRLARRAGSYVTLRGDDPLSGTLPALGNLLAAKQLDAGDVQFPLYLINGRPPGDPYGLEVRRGERVRLRVDQRFGRHAVRVLGQRPSAHAGRKRRPGGRAGRRATRSSSGWASAPTSCSTPTARAPTGWSRCRSARPAAQSRRCATPTRPRSTMPSALAPVKAPARMIAYEDLRDAAGAETAKPGREIRLDLAQDMSKPYRWTMGGQSFPEADMIELAHDERVRFVIRNRTMMAHPMHLHGHFLRDVDLVAGRPAQGHDRRPAAAHREARPARRQPRRVDVPLPQPLPPVGRDDAGRHGRPLTPRPTSFAGSEALLPGCNGQGGRP